MVGEEGGRGGSCSCCVVWLWLLLLLLCVVVVVVVVVLCVRVLNGCLCVFKSVCVCVFKRMFGAFVRGVLCASTFMLASCSFQFGYEQRKHGLSILQLCEVFCKKCQTYCAVLWQLSVHSYVAS